MKRRWSDCPLNCFVTPPAHALRQHAQALAMAAGCAKAARLEEAVAAYRAAAEVYTREAMPSAPERYRACSPDRSGWGEGGFIHLSE